MKSWIVTILFFVGASMATLSCSSSQKALSSSSEVMTLDQPRLSCRMIEEFRSIEITIENPSKWDLIFTDRIGFVHARVFGGEEKGDHLIDDGFNMDLSRLNATDLTTVAAGAKFTFTRACRDGEFRRITAKDDIKVFIDPVTIDSFKLDEQPKVKGFAARFLKERLEATMTGWQPRTKA